MQAFLITIWAAILRLCGSSPPASTSPARSQNRPKPRPEPAPRSRRVRLSRVTGPRRALRTIADSVGQMAGFPRQPHDARDLEVAWSQLGDPVAGFVQAQIALGETIPQFLANKDEDAQYERLAIRAMRSPSVYIKAIWREAPVRASLQATSVLADRVQRLFRGHIPQPLRTGGPAGEAEWHVLDSMGRPVICRLFQHADGRLEILDAGGGFLHPDTLKLSCWHCQEGWLLPVGFQIRGRNDGDGNGSPRPEPQPNSVVPKI